MAKTIGVTKIKKLSYSSSLCHLRQMYSTNIFFPSLGLIVEIKQFDTHGNAAAAVACRNYLNSIKGK